MKKTIVFFLLFFSGLAYGVCQSKQVSAAAIESKWARHSKGGASAGRAATTY